MNKERRTTYETGTVAEVYRNSSGRVIGRVIRDYRGSARGPILEVVCIQCGHPWREQHPNCKATVTR